MSGVVGHIWCVLAALFVLFSLAVGGEEGLFSTKQGHGHHSNQGQWAAGLGYDAHRPIGGHDEKVEGCFSKFDVMETVVLGREELNNLRCQAACTDRGYSLAATSGNTTCFCSNNYPTILQRVDTRRCNHPCSPDRRSCFLHTCCGTADGRLFTVSWSGEIDIMLQLLRRLSFDYRTNSSTFRRRVEGSSATTGPGAFCTHTTLQATDSLYLSLGGGCADGWSAWDRGCYDVHWAKRASYAEAQEACRMEGGGLVTVTSAAENQFLLDMQGGCQGWVGNAPPSNASMLQSRKLLRLGEGAGGGQHAAAATALPFENWEVGHGPRDVQISKKRMPAALGPATTATAFDEPPVAGGVRGLRQIVVRYATYVDGLQLVYELANGSMASGGFWGNETLLDSTEAVVELGEGEVVTKVGANVHVANGQLSGLVFRTVRRRMAAGAAAVEETMMTYGPFGTGEGVDESSAVEYRPAGVIVGIYGTTASREEASGRLTSVGFYEWVQDGCSMMDAAGTWHTVPCNSTDVAKAGLCESQGLVCPSGWMVRGGTCYHVIHRARGLSWLEARSRCHALGGYLVALGTRDENELARSMLGPVGGGFIGLHKGAGEGSAWSWDVYDNTADRLLSSDTPYTPMVASTGAAAVAAAEQCFEMESSGRWRVVSCKDRPRGSRVVMCERGADQEACNCSSLDGLDGGQQWDGPWVAHGCTCYRQMVTGGGGRPQLSWMEAQGVCASVGGRLVSVASSEENEWVRGRLQSALFLGTGFVPGYLGLNNLADRERYEWGYYENWSNEDLLSQATMAGETMTSKTAAGNERVVVWGEVSPPGQDSGAGEFGQMGEDGKWLRASCHSRTSTCYVCKRERDRPYPNLRRGAAEQWHVDVVDGRDDGWRGGPRCDDCFPAYLRHVSTSSYLCIDAQHLIFMSYARDAAWCLLTLVVNPMTGGMAVVTAHGAALFYDDDSQSLHVEMLTGDVAFTPSSHPPPPAAGGGGKPWQLRVLSTPGLAVFTTSCTLTGLARRYLRLNIISRSKRKHPRGGHARQCSVAAYDDTPQTESYRCEPLLLPPSPDDVITLEPRALRISEDGSYVMPRRPIRNARLTCINELQRDTANCVLSYGEALLLLKRFRVQWGYFLFDEIASIWQLSGLQSVLLRYPVPTKPPSACLDNNKRNGTKKQDCPPPTPTAGGGNATGGGGGAGAGGGGGTATIPAGGLTQGGFPATGNLQTSGGATSIAPGGGGAAANAILGGATQRARPPTGGAITNTIAFPIREQVQLQNTLRAAFNNFYQFVAIRILIETRTWQFGAQHPPRTALTIQAFYSATYLRYRWEVLLQARGAVIITCFGRRIIAGDGPFSLGDVSSGVDLNFRVFGRYEFPYEATIHLTNRENFFNSWQGLGSEPMQSVGDETAPVTTFLPTERGNVEDTLYGWDFDGKMHEAPHP